MSKESICKEARAKMEKVVVHLQEELRGLRTGRASTVGGKYKGGVLWRFVTFKTNSSPFDS